MTSTKIKPRLICTLLCDDVRHEVGGKFSLMGLFESIYANAFPAIHPRFAIMNEWTGGKGEFRARIRLLSPNQQQVLSESESAMSLFNETQRHRDISVRFNTPFASPGTYWVEMLIDNERTALVPLPVQMISDKNATNVH